MNESPKGPLSYLRQFLAPESHLKAVKKTFYFVLEALFVPNIFKCLSWLFGHAGKPLDNKAKVNFKYYDATDWTIVNCYTNTAQYFKE